MEEKINEKNNFPPRSTDLTKERSPSPPKSTDLTTEPPRSTDLTKERSPSPLKSTDLTTQTTCDEQILQNLQKNTKNPNNVPKFSKNTKKNLIENDL